MRRCSFCGFLLEPHKERYCTLLCEVLDEMKEEPHEERQEAAVQE